MKTRFEWAQLLDEKRALGQKIVFTNGCFDILHAGHIDLLQKARELGDFLVVGLNSDASIKRLKGESRPIHDQNARAQVMSALGCVDAVLVFEEDTPVETIRELKPDIHVKGGDYRPDDLPEAGAVREGGGEIVIVPLVAGFSTTLALEKSRAEAVIVIPARYGSTRFPGKPLVPLAGESVISRVVRATLQTQSQKPILVATDDARIATEIKQRFTENEALAVMTSPDCHTGTDRLAEAIRARFGEPKQRLIVVNVQGDEPFIEPQYVDSLIEMMRADETLQMATLATPILEKRLESDSNVVKVVVSEKSRALYFSRSAIPFDRDGNGATMLRHLGIYAYDARWLLEMAALSPSRLEEIEKLEQLRALEHGVEIGVAVVENVVPIAIDTPEDLERAEAWLADA
ncbi:3-deoxy-D-manno-octulosonate cytidylyltransferase [Abditibacterium utsteinense]|uniref:3-deoxy-manno-octulosonate cytidylyltransferase n=2 Tax=Abditibacterium utsteinense TaxID=1960156 RepID=A0A2S8SX58_9BACT|nr:3-deoxy-D-manno-octulosonate cytidylyltransferase [Abditibacterium utsteinense]